MHVWRVPHRSAVNKLLRLVGVVGAGSVLLASSAVSLTVIGDDLLHHSASAAEFPLPPLASTLQEGSTIYADDGTTVLGVLQASEYRKPVSLSHVSKTMITAVLDTEDHQFYLHGGFDISSMIRALAADSSGSGGLQGGSTIAQQLAKQLYLTSSRTLSRKVKEAVIADRLERKYTKDQILEAYLNTIYLGNGAYGVEAAALTYFGEHATRLNLPQSALLAGMIANPNGYSPYSDPEAARNRRSQVLDRMVHYKDITQAKANAANATALPTPLPPPPTAGDNITNYYVEQVRDQLLGAGSPLGSTYTERYQALFEGGLKIYTNLDPSVQAAAEQAVAQDTPPNSQGFEEAMVAIDPATGKVRAMVGGAGVNSNHFNIITQGTRQPGSGFKLFTLLAALQQGYSIFDTVDSQSPCAILFPGDSDLARSPIHNDAGNGGGAISLESATAGSVNCAFIRLAHEVGLPNVIAMAHSLGISETIPQYPSIVLGSVAVHPIEMAAAYAAVADDGVYHAPSFIDHIVDRTGETVYTGQSPGHRVVSSQVAREATVAFQAVVQYGTGTAAELYNRPVAGKTGTTTNNVDAWFNGFTPQLEASVWMGNISAEIPMFDVGGITVYGATYPAHTWHDFAAVALANVAPQPFALMSYGLLPPSKYISSLSLIEDDILDHNSAYQPPPPSNPPATTPPATAPPPSGGGGGAHHHSGGAPTVTG